MTDDDGRPLMATTPRDLGCVLSCERCGTRTLQWWGQCPACGEPALDRPVVGL